MNKNIKIIALLLLILTYSSCNMFFDNPVDPESENYQGYITVDSVDDVESYELEKSSFSEPPTLIVSELRNAQKYKWQLSQNQYYMDGGDVFHTLQNMFQPSSSYLNSGTWYWRARAVDSNGIYGEWTEVREFYMDYNWEY